MSYTELHKGKLVPIKDCLSTGEFLEWLESNKGFYVDDLEEKVEDGYDTLEVFNTEDVLAYLYTKNVLYQVTDYSGGEYCSDEINLTFKQPDGSIDFMYLFYNGGTCFSGMLEEGLERVKQSMDYSILPEEVEPLKKYKHHNGNIYKVLFFTNYNSDKKESPVSVVYEGENGLLWSRSLDSFCKSFVKV